MKCVRSLQTEPAMLAAYRANPAAGAQRPAAAAAEVWTRFRKRAPEAYQELVQELARRQQGLCIYCEQRLVDEGGSLLAGRYQVEHVLPKSGAVGRVLGWANLALACWGTGSGNADKSCGFSKGNQQVPALCDPRTFPLIPRVVVVGTDGRIAADTASCQIIGISNANLDSAINTVLNLNCDRLSKPRQDAGDVVREKVVELLRALASADIGALQQQQAFEEFVAECLSPDAAGHLEPFWTTELQALGAPAEAWLTTNQGQFT